jgi:hypothetical protein
VKRYFLRVEKELECTDPFDVAGLREPIVIMPVQYWGKLTNKALQVAYSMSKEVEAVHVRSEGEKYDISAQWNQYVTMPARGAGLAEPKLTLLDSPYRLVIAPIVNYVLEIQQANPTRRIAVMVPEMIEHHWWHYFLENNRAELLKALLLLRGNQRIILINVPWYLKS